MSGSKNRTKKAEEVNLKRYPATMAAWQFIADQGLVRRTFVAGPANPYQSVADYWSILKIEAQKKGRQLTLEEVEKDFEMHQEIVSYLYGMYYHKRYSKYGNAVTQYSRENKEDILSHFPKRAQEIIAEIESKKEK